MPLQEAIQLKPKEPITCRSDTHVNPIQNNPRGNRIRGTPVHLNIRNLNSKYIANKHVQPEGKQRGEEERESNIQEVLLPFVSEKTCGKLSLLRKS